MMLILMPFRFWRRLKVARGVSLNLSKGGVSVSIGPRGAKMTLGSRGARATVGIPGDRPLPDRAVRGEQARFSPEFSAFPQTSAIC